MAEDFTPLTPEEREKLLKAINDDKTDTNPYSLLFVRKRV